MRSTVGAENIVDDNRQLDFCDRVLLVLQQQRRSKSWLAEQIGVSKQAINYLLYHSSSPRYVNEIASVLEVTPEWLLFAKGSPQIAFEDNAAVLRVPILAFDSLIPYFSNKDKNLISGYTHASPVHAVSSSCFAVMLESASMEPLFNQGSLLIFNAGLFAKSKDFVIFHHKKDNQIYFRQYLSEGSNIYFKTFDIIFTEFKSGDITMLGVLVESRNIFK